MAAKNGKNLNFSILHSTTLSVKHLVEIALSLMVSEILAFFVFQKKSRWPTKCFPFLHTTPLYYPIDKKFGRNHYLLWFLRY